MEDWRLLREYLENGSEAAFTELMDRHLNLVYSAALRRLGDPEAAKDVAQSVFCLLAQKARRLSPRTALVGWLYQSACFKASCYWRDERRRHRRELEAAAMHDTNTDRENAWEQMAPHLDGAIEELTGPDRLAILLRFFQRKPLREVGAALGVGEDAARMRVNRALERLRFRLFAKGVGCSAVALAAALEERTVQAAPVWAAESVRAAAIEAAKVASVPSLLTTLLLVMARTKAQTAIAAGVLLLLGIGTGLHVVNRYHEPARQDPGSMPAEANTLASGTRPAADLEADLANAASAQPAGPSNRLRLVIVTADTGRPVPMVLVDCEFREEDSATTKAFQATRFGVCEIIYPARTTTGLRLTSKSDDFADTSIEWRPDRGESIPSEYTLRVTRAASIGGRVVEAQGEPVAAASVSLSMDWAEVPQKSRPESNVTRFRAETDAEGRWSIKRVATELLPRLSGAAEHPEHGYAVMSGTPEARQQLLAGTYVFRLVRDLTVRGAVVTADGQPVPEATVGVQSYEIGEARLGKTVTEADGSFSIPNCRPGKNRVTAIAKGFSPASLETELSASCAFNILEPFTTS